MHILVDYSTLHLMTPKIKKQILLIEDEHAIASLYKFKLELHNLEVIHAQNGLEGLKMIKTNIPNLILLDLRMPIMDGEEFLRKFRKEELHSDIPVLILTNISRDEAPKTLWHYGISGYFVKAYHTPADLYSQVMNVLDQQQ